MLVPVTWHFSAVLLTYLCLYFLSLRRR